LGVYPHYLLAYPNSLILIGTPISAGFLSIDFVDRGKLSRGRILNYLFLTYIYLFRKIKTNLMPWMVFKNYVSGEDNENQTNSHGPDDADQKA